MSPTKEIIPTTIPKTKLGILSVHLTLTKPGRIQISRYPGRQVEIPREGCRKISDGIGYECFETQQNGMT